MPSDQEKTDLLFKQVFGVAETNTTKKYFEESIYGRSLILPENICVGTIPATSPGGSPQLGVAGTYGDLQLIQNLSLTPVDGSGIAFYHANLKRSIPFNYDPAGSYLYYISRDLGAGGTQIYFGEKDWVVDNNTGVLTFYGGLPTGVSSVLPPRISFYRYIGAVGASPGTISLNNVLANGNITGGVNVVVTSGDKITSSAGELVVEPSTNFKVNRPTGISRAIIATGDASDTVTSFQNSSTTWSIGIDSSDSNSWVVSHSATLGTNNAVHIDSSENVTLPNGTLTVNDDISLTKTSGASELTINTAGTADAYINFTRSAVDWSIGIDQSDSDKYIISRAATLGTNNVLEIDGSGDITINNDLTVLGSVNATISSTDNIFNINTVPVAGQDGGYVSKRHQTDIVSDTATETGTAQAGAATTVTLTAGANAADDYYNGWYINITGGTGSGQTRQITDYVGASKIATVSVAWGTNPDGTSSYNLFGRTYVGAIYDESADEIVMGFIGEDGTTPINTGLADVRAGKLVVNKSAVANADAQVTIVNDTATYSLGVDASDSDKFVLSRSTALGTNNVLTVDVSENIVIPNGTLTVNDDISLSKAAGVGLLTVVTAAAADAQLKLTDNTTSWSAGVDNSASSKFVISNSTTLGTDNAIEIDVAENVVIPNGTLTVNDDISLSKVTGVGLLTVATSAAADAQIKISDATATWSAGVDNSASSKFVISNSATLGTDNAIEIDVAENIVIPNGTLTVNDDATLNKAAGVVLLSLTTAGAADSQLKYTDNTTIWSTGVDNSDSSKYVISHAAVLGTNNVFEANVAGDVTINNDLTVLGNLIAAISSNDNIFNIHDSPASAGKDVGWVAKRHQTDVVADTANETGTAQAGAATTITLTAGANATDDYYNGWYVSITAGTGSGQTRQITDYVGTSKVATVGVAWGTNPDGTSVYSLFGHTFVGTIYDESTDEVKLGYIGADGDTPINTGLVDVRAGKMVLDKSAVASADVQLTLINDTTTFSFGLDSSDANKLVLSRSPVVGTNNVLTIDSSDNVVIPSGTLTVNDDIAMSRATGVAKISTTTANNSDAQVNFTAGSTPDDWVIGIDQSDSSTFKITHAATLGGASDYLLVKTNGEVLVSADPISALGVATKQFVENFSQGIEIKASVKTVTIAALPTYTFLAGGTPATTTLTATANGSINITGIGGKTNLVVADRVLLTGDGTTSDVHNGIYTVTDVGSAGTPWVLTRAADFTGIVGGGEVVSGTFTLVTEGTCLNCGFAVITQDPIVVDTTGIVFTQFSGAPVLMLSLDDVLGQGNETGGYDIVMTSGDHITTTSNSNLVLNPNGTGDIEIAAGKDIVTTSGNLVINPNGSSLVDIQKNAQVNVTSGDANISIVTATANDAYVDFANNTASWSAGIDQSNSDKFIISNSATLGTDNAIEIDVAENVVIPNGTLTVNDDITLSKAAGVPLLTVSTAAAADSQLRFTNSATSWSMGIDNSDSNRFILSESSSLGTNNVLRLDATNSGIVGIGFDTGTRDGSIYIGNRAGTALTTSGGSDILIGYRAGVAMTTGARNIVMGDDAGDTITTGSDNVILGHAAGGLMGTSAALATVVGSSAGVAYTGTTGIIAIGRNAASSVTSGIGNVAVGTNALGSETTGARNTVIGHEAGLVQVGGSDNTLMGYQAGDTITDGDDNILIGSGAGSALTSGSANLIIGKDAGIAITTTSGTLIIGNGAGDSITSGTQNLLIGNNAGNDINTGARNIIVGDSGGNDLTTGSDNLMIGVGGGGIISGTQNVRLGTHSSYGGSVDRTVAIGYNSSAGADDDIAIGSLAATDGTGKNIVIGNSAIADDGASTITNSVALGYKARVSADNSVVLGSINGTNTATVTHKVGRGVAVPTEALHIHDPDGAVAIKLSSDASGGTNDVKFQWTTDDNGTPSSWVAGIDASTANADWVLSRGTVLGTTTAMSVNGSTLDITMPNGTLTVNDDISLAKATGVALNTISTAAAADAQIKLSDATATWSAGVDNSASSRFVISNSATLGTDNAIEIDTAENVTIPNGTLTVNEDITLSRASGVALLSLTTAGAADSQLKYTDNTTVWSTGVDNSDGSKYVISHAAVLGTNNVFEATTAGNVTINNNLTVLGTLTASISSNDNILNIHNNPVGSGKDVGWAAKRHQTDTVADIANETGTAQAGGATTITLAVGANAADDFYNGWYVSITAGTGNGQIRQITDYVGASKVATVGVAWGTNPDGTSVYSLFGHTLVGVIYDESADEVKIGYIGEDGDTPLNTGLTDVRSGKMIIDKSAVANADAQLTIINDTSTFSLGVDASDSDKLVLSRSSTLGTNNVLTVDSSDNVVIPNGTLTVNDDIALSKAAGVALSTIITAAAADAQLRLTDNTTSWSIGVDNSASSKLVISNSTTLGTDNAIEIDVAENVVIPNGTLTVNDDIILTKAAGVAASSIITAAAADSQLIMTNSGTTFSIGIDQSDSNTFVLSNSATLGTTNILKATNSIISSEVDVELNNEQEIRFKEAVGNGSNYVGFKAAAALAGNQIWTLPTADGTSGQFLQTNGTGTLSFTGNILGANRQIIVNFGGTPVTVGSTTFTVFGKFIWDDSRHDGFTSGNVVFNVTVGGGRDVNVRVFNVTTAAALGGTTTTAGTGFYVHNFTLPTADAVLEIQASRTAGAVPSPVLEHIQLEFST